MALFPFNMRLFIKGEILKGTKLRLQHFKDKYSNRFIMNKLDGIFDRF